MRKIDGTMALAVVVAMLVACSPSTGSAGDKGASPAAPASASASGGREIEPEAVPLVQGGAKIAASAVACGLATRAQAEEGFADQRAAYVGRGYSAASFDRVVDDAFRETSDRFARASAAEKAQACESVRQLGDQFKQMGEDMQHRQGSTP